MLGPGWRAVPPASGFEPGEYPGFFLRRSHGNKRPGLGLTLILFHLDSSAHGGSMSNSKPVHRQFLFLVLAACVSVTASAQTRPKRTDLGAAPTGILWVGNSFFYYNSSMHNHVSNLVRAADPKSAPRATSVTISGSGIDWHDMESYFRPDGIGKYSFVGDNDNDALVIPAGLAFAKAIARRPDLEFYQPDKRYPSLIGTYLAACTAYAAVFRKSPVGNTYAAGIDPATARFLQQAAQNTVQEYFGR